jgi:hypothetical protein
MVFAADESDGNDATTPDGSFHEDCLSSEASGLDSRGGRSGGSSAASSLTMAAQTALQMQTKTRTTRRPAMTPDMADHTSSVTGYERARHTGWIRKNVGSRAPLPVASHWINRYTAGVRPVAAGDAA